MTTLETLRQAIHDKGITLDERHLPHTISMSHMDHDGDLYIAIDRDRVESAADEEVRLLHETGHCMTGSFYCQHTAYESRERLEARANRWAIKERLPLKELRRAIKRCLPHNDCELAEELGLTVDFVRKAIQYYTDRGLISDD